MGDQIKLDRIEGGSLVAYSSPRNIGVLEMNQMFDWLGMPHIGTWEGDGNKKIGLGWDLVDKKTLCCENCR